MRSAVSRSSVSEMVRRARALLFDFDGTLVDSNPVKRSAFDECFAEFPEKLSAIRTYCHGNNHTPRWEKFKYVYEQILHLPYTEADAHRLKERYAALTTEKIIRAPETPGATAFLTSLPAWQKTGLLSSTPHETLLHILRERGWLGRFGSVQGAPVEKGPWIKEFCLKRNLQRDDVVFFGDTPEDAKAAREAGSVFIAVFYPALAPQADAFLQSFEDILNPWRPPAEPGNP